MKEEGMRQFGFPVVWLLLGCLASPVAAGEDPLERRMEELRGFFRKDPGEFKTVFHASFLAAVPPARLKILLASLHAKHGKCTGAILLERKGAHAGVFELAFEKDVVVQSTLSVADKPPHKVTGWWMGAPEPAAADFKAILAAFKKLPGKVSFSAARLGEGHPTIVASLNPDTPLAIGSTFKLYVLGAAAKAVGQGDLAWTTTVNLRKPWTSLPSGRLQTWPERSPVTVHSLAVFMISISDNTATDHLLFKVGRRRVEAILEPMGNRTPGRNIPFLSTLELFKLKLSPGAKAAERYLGLPAEERREFLDTVLRKERVDATRAGSWTRPVHIESLEWFASASDLVRAMNWLRRAAERPGLKPLLPILSVNKGVSISEKAWAYAGFKGGSEPGVLNGTFLLRARSGAWYALSAGWNDPKKDVDKTAFFGLIQGAIRILAKEKKGNGDGG
jgi:hypothetical protein